MTKLISLKFSISDADGNVTYKKGALNPDFISTLMDISDDDLEIGNTKITMADGEIHDVMELFGQVVDQIES